MNEYKIKSNFIIYWILEKSTNLDMGFVFARSVAKSVVPQEHLSGASVFQTSRNLWPSVM